MEAESSRENTYISLACNAGQEWSYSTFKITHALIIYHIHCKDAILHLPNFLLGDTTHYSNHMRRHVVEGNIQANAERLCMSLAACMPNCHSIHCGYTSHDTHVDTQ